MLSLLTWLIDLSFLPQVSFCLLDSVSSLIHASFAVCLFRCGFVFFLVLLTLRFLTVSDMSYAKGIRGKE
jgi:hypothetical protein